MEEEKALTIAQRTRDEFKTMREIVLVVLETSERARNDDNHLILCVMKRLGEKITVRHSATRNRTVIDWKDITIEDLGSFETITRVRREIQNDEGKFLPTDKEIAIKRRIREETIRAYYGETYK